MFGKFLLVLLVAVSCTQGASYYDRQEVDANKDIIGDIIEKIKSVIAKLGDLILNLEAKIKEIIAGIDIGQIIKGIEEEIKKIIDKVPKQCIVAAKEAVDRLVIETTDQVATCSKSAAEEASALISEALSLISEAEGFENDIKERVEKCMKDNMKDPWGLKKCLEEQAEQVKGKVEHMMAQGKDLMKKAESLYSNVTACVSAVQKDVNDKSTAIIADFQKCIQVPEL